MRELVGWVRELVGYKVLFWALVGYFEGEVFCTIHALLSFAEDNFCADSVEDLPSFKGHIFGHNEEEIVAFHAADEG